MPIMPVNGQGIFYQDSGGDKPAVIFMHGFLFDQHMFDAQVSALEADFRCIRFDARGFGQTEWDGNAFDMYDTASDCLGLMDSLGLQQAVIVGMSQGGYAALRFAIRYPERLKALVLMSTFTGVRPDDFAQVYQAIRDNWVQNGPVDPMLDQLMTVLIGPKEKTEAFWQAWRPRWKDQSGDSIYHTINALLDRDVIEDAQVSAIPVPALVIHGKEDHGIPFALGQQMAKLLSHNKGLVEVSGAAHAANMTHPHIVNPALHQFLKQYA